MKDDITKILEGAGYKTVTGADAVKKAIRDAEIPGDSTPLCSGYGVFPDGRKCEGCDDCKKKENT